MTHDVIVIGAGHNGLVAGCYLARAGLDVMVLEARPEVGGMSWTASLIPEAPNHRVNPCALDIVFLQASRVIQDLKLAVHGYRQVEVDPVNVSLHPEGPSIAFWRDPRRTAEEIRAFSREDAEAFLELSRELDAALDIGLPFMMTNPLRPGARAVGKAAAAVLRHRRRVMKMASLLIAPVAQTIDERFRHPIVRDALVAQTGVVGPITNDGSGLLFMFLPSYHRFGAWRVIGGTQGLPDALKAALHSFGGNIKTGAVVQEILVSGERATGVRLESGEELHARRAVIASCDPRSALGTLLPDDALDPSLRARVEHIPACGDGWASLTVHLALSGQLHLDRYEKWRNDGLDLRKPAVFIGDYAQATDAYRQARMGEVPAQIGMWAAIPTAVDPSQAPPGQDTFYMWASPMPLEPRAPWSEAAKAVITRAAEIWDGIEDLEIGRKVESPQDLAREMRLTNGCLYHTDMTLTRLGPLRPASGLAGYRMPIRGLYLGGAGSHPSAAVSGLPGWLAAREVLRGEKG